MVDFMQGRRLDCLPPQRFDPRQLAHVLPRLTAAPDRATPRYLSDHLLRIEDQGQIGSCTAHTTTTIIETTRQRIGRDAKDLNRGWAYWYARLIGNWYGFQRGADTGATIQDACDAVVKYGGVPRQDIWAYVQDSHMEPPASLNGDCPNQAWAASHAPLFQTDAGGVTAGILDALDRGFGVALGMPWFGDYMDLGDTGGVLMKPNGQQGGGHAIGVLDYTPSFDVDPLGLYWCANSWSEEWSRAWVPAMQRHHPRVRPGMFAIAGSVLETRGLLWEARVIVLNPVPAPEPEPEPPPRRKVYVQIWTPNTAGDFDIAPLEREVPDAGAWVTVKQQRGTEPEQVIVPFMRVEP